MSDDVFRNLKPLPSLWWEDEHGNRAVFPADHDGGGDDLVIMPSRGYHYMHSLIPVVTESVFRDHDKVLDGETTINTVESIVMHLIQHHGWSMVDAIVLASQLCSRCLNILSDIAEGRQPSPEGGTHCEMCKLVDPDYDKAYIHDHPDMAPKTLTVIHAARRRVTAALAAVTDADLEAKGLTSTSSPSMGKFWLSPSGRLWPIQGAHAEWADKHLGGYETALDSNWVRVGLYNDSGATIAYCQVGRDSALDNSTMPSIFRAANYVEIETPSMYSRFKGPDYFKSNMGMSEFITSFGERRSSKMHNKSLTRVSSDTANEDGHVLTSQHSADELSLVFNEDLFDYYLRSEDTPPNYYITEIAGMKVGFGSKYQLKKFLLKLKTDVFTGGIIPASNIRVQPIPHIDSPIIRRLGAVKVKPVKEVGSAADAGKIKPMGEVATNWEVCYGDENTNQVIHGMPQGPMV